MTKDEAFNVIVARYTNERHIPKRECLGCGTSVDQGHNGFIQCDGRGVHYDGRSVKGEWIRYEFSWAAINRQAKVISSGQMELWN